MFFCLTSAFWASGSRRKVPCCTVLTAFGPDWGSFAWSSGSTYWKPRCRWLMDTTGMQLRHVTSYIGISQSLDQHTGLLDSQGLQKQDRIDQRRVNNVAYSCSWERPEVKSFQQDKLQEITHTENKLIKTRFNDLYVTSASRWSSCGCKCARSTGCTCI